MPAIIAENANSSDKIKKLKKQLDEMIMKNQSLEHKLEQSNLEMRDIKK